MIAPSLSEEDFQNIFLLEDNSQQLSEFKLVSLKKFMNDKGIKEEDKDWKVQNAFRIFATKPNENLLKIAKKQVFKFPVATLENASGDKKLIITDFNKSTKTARLELARAAENLTTFLGDHWSDIATTGGIGAEGDVPFSDGKKPLKLLSRCITTSTQPREEAIILDFFAGSGTTAHAVMQLNAEDGGNRRCISVQIPEEIDPDDKDQKVAYDFCIEHNFNLTIAEISKERIRRAGARILEGKCHPDWKKDIGFRVLKVDESNMKDVYYRPDEFDQKHLLQHVDNIKPDRTGEDMLFQVLVDWGVDLTLPIRHQKVEDKSVYFVDDDALIACFETDIDEELFKKLTTHKPLRVVFRDKGFEGDDLKVNITQIFLQASPKTDVKVI